MPAAAVNPLLAPLIEELRKIKKLHGDLQVRRGNLQKIITTYESQPKEVRARFSKEHLTTEMDMIPPQLETLLQQYRERVAQLIEMVRWLQVKICAHPCFMLPVSRSSTRRAVSLSNVSC
jgi:chromosome segregation ATPase